MVNYNGLQCNLHAMQLVKRRVVNIIVCRIYAICPIHSDADVAWFGWVLCIVVSRSMVWCGLVKFGLTWCDVVECGVNW